jgi:hypothetical protein
MAKVRPLTTRFGTATGASVLLLAVLAWLAPPPSGRAQTGSSGNTQTLPAGTPKAWMQAAALREAELIQDDHHPMRYTVRKIDRKGDTTREVIESQQGNVARLTQRDGKPISAAEDADERSRLNEILDSPDAFLKHQQNETSGRSYSLQLIKLLPSAMTFAYDPGQPQPAGARSPQVVIDFQPNPAFHPPSMVTELLTGLAGRIWIDARSGTMTRIEGQVLRPVNFGWGVLARVFPGGHIELEQTFVDGKRWAYSHVDEDLTVREIMLRTVNDKTRMTAWNFQLLPAPVTFQQAVHTLMDEKIPLQ